MFKLTLTERDSPHMLEEKKRYAVKVNGREVDELRYNMSNYQGYLMTVFGGHFTIGERGISTWKRAVADLNREAREVRDRMKGDQTSFASIRPTSNGDVVKLTFEEPDGQKKELFATRRVAYAGLELLGYNGLHASFFPEEELHAPLGAPEEDPVTDIQGPIDETLCVMDVFDTVDADWKAVVVGYIPQDIFDAALRAHTKDELDCEILKEMDPQAWAQSATRIVFIDTENMEDLCQRHGRAFMKAEHLPGRGFCSATPEVFTPMLTSTGQRPDIIMGEGDAGIYRDTEMLRGYRLKVMENVPSPEMDM